MASRLPHNVRCLLAARAARSVGQGATVATFSLYLHALGFGGPAIGLVLMAGLAFGAVLTLIIGPLSDRVSRRRLLIIYEISALLAAGAAIVSPNEGVLIAAATLAGFGRGANGAAGPFSPVEQAWIAREVDGEDRRRALAHVATLGFLGMGLGAILVVLPPLFGHAYTQLSTFRILFILPLAGSLIGLALLATTREAAPVEVAPALDVRAEAHLKREENRSILKLAVTNAINGLAIGIVGPLIAYWFLRRYAQGPAAIGPALAASFMLGAVGAMLANGLSRRFGSVRSVIAMRIVGLALLLAVPFSPDFDLAAGLYALRGAFNRGTAGVRQAVAAALTRAERRGVAASAQNLSVQIPRAIGPILGGWLIQRGDFITPFLVTAALQALYLILYQRFFGAVDPARSRTEMDAAP